MAYKQDGGYTFHVEASDPDEGAMTWSWTSYADSGIVRNGNAWNDARMMWRDAAPFASSSHTGWIKWDTSDQSVALALKDGVHGRSQKTGRYAVSFTARQDSAEDFSRPNVPRCTAVGWILIPTYCSANS